MNNPIFTPNFQTNQKQQKQMNVTSHVNNYMLIIYELNVYDSTQTLMQEWWFLIKTFLNPTPFIVIDHWYGKCNHKNHYDTVAMVDMSNKMQHYQLNSIEKRNAEKNLL